MIFQNSTDVSKDISIAIHFVNMGDECKAFKLTDWVSLFLAELTSNNNIVLCSCSASNTSSIKFIL